MSQPTIILETPRLIVRELLPEDEAGMFAMDSDPEVHRYLGNRPCHDTSESQDTISLVREQYAELGIGRWAMLLKEDGDFVGWTGFKRITEPVNGHVNHLDFGYRLARRHWGKGLATESARAALDYGIDALGFRDIYAMTDVANGASRHILEGLGFRFVEIFPYDGTPFWRAGLPVTWYRFFDARLS